MYSNNTVFEKCENEYSFLSHLYTPVIAVCARFETVQEAC
jgi:hypothetical protein